MFKQIQRPSANIRRRGFNVGYPSFPLNSLSLAILLLSPASALAEEAFNTDFFHGPMDSADLKNFLESNSVAPGTYRVDLYINRVLTTRRDVTFRKSPDNGKVQACLTLDTLQLLGVNIQKHPGLQQQDDCPDLPRIIERATVAYDPARLKLEVNVPQASMLPTARGYIDPQLWDYGVNAGFINYQLTGRDSRYDGGHQQNYNLGLRNGLNIGPWRLRNDSAFSQNAQRGRTFQSNRTFAQRDVSGLKSQLTLGETYTSSQIFDSVRFQGLEMASDEAMLPDSERGYAPSVRGNADTNATVEIRQNGYLLYTTNVSAGPFEINEIFPSGSNGDLEVTVIESDGQRRTFIQSFASLPQMVRGGAVRYNVALGRYSNTQEGPTPWVGTGGITYGLTDSTSVFGGVQSSQGFWATNAGVTQNTPWGAMGMDLTKSISEVRNKNSTGESLRLSYAKTLTTTNTTFTLANYRFSTEGYRTLATHVADMSNIDRDYLIGRARNRFQVRLDQSLGDGNGTVYLDASDQNYWNINGSTQSLRAGYANSWRSISYNLSVAHTRNPQDERLDNENRFTLSLSFPLGSSPRAPLATTDINYNGHNNQSIRTRLGGRLPGYDNVSYHLQSGADSANGGSSSASLNALTPYARLGAGYSEGGDYQAFDVSAAGAVVAHGGGVNFGQTVGDTFALVSLPNVEGVGISNATGVSTAANGYAVFPFASPYRANWVSLDTGTIATDLDIENPIAQVVPRRGSITLARFEAQTGRRVQFQFLRGDHQPIPFGASVMDQEGRQLTITDPSGMALVFAQADEGTLSLKWGEQRCTAKYALDERNPERSFEKFQAVCE